jgi:hypothetical protein
MYARMHALKLSVSINRVNVNSITHSTSPMCFAIVLYGSAG